MTNADFLIWGRRIKMLGLGTVLLTTVFLFETCTSSGNVSIFLSEYNNPHGYLADGNRCTNTACDHYFIVCLDQLNGSVSNISQCSLGKYTTEPTTGKNHIFNNTIKPNPEDIPFDKWLGGALLKVEVRDNKRHPRNNLVDFLSTSVNIKANGSRKNITMQTFQPKRKSNTTLHLEIRAFCNENWYGPKCDFYCKPTNDKNTHIYNHSDKPHIYTCYVNTTTTNSLEEAREVCQEKNMTLLTIENEEVSKIINSHFHKKTMWLDYKTEVYNKSKWLNGTDVADSDVTSNPAAAQCVLLYEGSDMIVFMKTENCHETNKFICSDTNDSHPHINYVLNDDLSTWFEAREKCKEIGSDLYLPMEIQIVDLYYTVEYWIGASNFACFTGNHTRATYTPWAENQPKVRNKKECVVRTLNGEWRTSRCNTTKSHTVICQKDTTSPNDINSDQMVTMPVESQSTGTGQGSKMSNFTLGALVGSAVSGLALIIAGLVLWKMCQMRKRDQSKISQDQAYRVGLDDIEPYGISTSPPGQPMIDDNPYSDIDERKEMGRNTYCNMRGGAANDTRIYINQHEETQTEANAYLNPRDDVQANTYLELLPNQLEETGAEADAYLNPRDDIQANTYLELLPN